MKNPRGITLVELLIALAILAVGFSALLYSQVYNLRASSGARTASETKAAANQVLEQKMAEVLVVQIDDTGATPLGSTNQITNTAYIDESNATLSGKNGVKQSFFFTDYYWSCPTVQTPPAGTLLPGRTLRSVACSGSTTLNGISVNWRVAGLSGVMGEGVLDVVVTATHPRGATITVGNRVSCYDIYPSPSANAPKPCPTPYNPSNGTFGGRS